MISPTASNGFYAEDGNSWYGAGDRALRIAFGKLDNAVTVYPIVSTAQYCPVAPEC